MADISAALTEQALTPATALRFPLEQTMDAHEAVRGGATGKVLVDVQRLK